MDLTISIPAFLAVPAMGLLGSLGGLIAAAVIGLIIASGQRMGGLAPIIIVVEYFSSPRVVIGLVATVFLALLSLAAWPASAVLITCIGSAIVTAVLGLSVFLR
jgi:hypothetical protein